MASWVLNTLTDATTRYEYFDFDSFCRAEDGKYYGIRADGIYLLEGETDAGFDIDSAINFGRLSLGTTALKHLTNAYAAVSSSAQMMLIIDGNTYLARGNSLTQKGQRFDVGKGLRQTYFTPIMVNVTGCAFVLDSLELAALATDRRI